MCLKLWTGTGLMLPRGLEAPVRVVHHPSAARSARTHSSNFATAVSAGPFTATNANTAWEEIQKCGFADACSRVR